MGIGNEGFPGTAGPEVAKLEAHVIIQAALGIDEATARDIATIRVACPYKGENPDEIREGSLGEFITNDHASAAGKQVLQIAKEELDDGANMEVAIRRGLGPSAIKDEDTGKLARVKQPENSDQLSTIIDVDDEKKK